MATIEPKDKDKEFTPEWFDSTSKSWRRNKIYLSSRQQWYYKTNTDSPFNLEDYKTKTPKHPNITNWMQCGYISSNGEVCHNEGVFYEDEVEIEKPEYDYEKYTEPHFCEKHLKYQKKEIQKRIHILEHLKTTETNTAKSAKLPE